MSAERLVVVGAGIVGAACAAELASHGFEVLVLDAHGIGGGATAAGMGHIVAMNDSPAELALSHYSRGLWLALAPCLRPCDAFVGCGTLWVAADDTELAAAHAMQAALAVHGVVADMLDARQLRDAEPALAADLVGAMRVPQDAIVYAPNAAEWLLRHSPAAARITVRLACPVEAVSHDSVLLRTGERITAAAVVVANGLQARSLVNRLPMVPKKGHLLITDRYPGFIRHQLVELGYVASAHQQSGASVAFNIQPRPTGQMLIGSSRQFDTEDTAVELPVLARMLARASRYLPGLGQLQGIRAWTGLRAATPDGLPLIGPSDQTDHPVWLAVGHEGLGVTTALGTARLLAAQLRGTPPEIPLGPYLPQRFQAGSHALAA